MTTYFWVGETATEDNAFIRNDESYFDGEWQESFGGVDDPFDRCGFKPCSFMPMQNPFYFALPYGDTEHDGSRKATAMDIPWYSPDAKEGVSILKNRWIEIRYGRTTCYAQWEDVGPFGEDDFDYVFGPSTRPQNPENNNAGLDVSPAVWTCLGMNKNDYTKWRFVEESEVPDGPWKEIVTRN